MVSSVRTAWPNMKQLLVKYWFLIGLLILIPSGLGVGTGFSEAAVEGWQSRVQPRWITAIVLLLMAFTLDSRQFRKSFQAPGPVLFACAINLALIPWLATWLVPFQKTADFQVGLMIAASVPCTLAAASVWTRKSGGNDAVSLLVTLTTNSICVVVTPFWLSFGISRAIEFDLKQMTLRLVLVVLLPTLFGQLARLNAFMRELAARRKIPIGVVAQGLILLLVFTAAMKAGLQLRRAPNSAMAFDLVVVGTCCILLHLIGASLAWWAGKLMSFTLSDRKAIVFASSQKTLPIGVLLATGEAMFGNAGVPFAIFPMLIYHASQLVIDTSIAHRLARIEESPTPVAQ